MGKLPINKVDNLLSDIQKGTSESDNELKIFIPSIPAIIQFGMYITGHNEEAVRNMYRNFENFQKYAKEHTDKNQSE